MDAFGQAEGLVPLIGLLIVGYLACFAAIVGGTIRLANPPGAGGSGVSHPERASAR